MVSSFELISFWQKWRQFALISKHRKAYQLLNDRSWRKADIRQATRLSEVRAGCFNSR